RQKEYLEKIRKTYNLMNLAHRPVLLDMIVRSLPDLIRSEREINAAGLYETYTDQWMDRDIKSHRTLLDSKEKKSLFMQELAFKMFLTGESSIHYKNMPEPVKQYFKLEKQPDIDYFSHDIMTCSFLIRDSEGNYRFAHKSFMEFFVAKKFSDEIGNKLKENLGRSPITREISNFLTDLIKDKNYSDILFDFIDYTKNKTLEEDETYIGGNAITILNAMGEKFIGKNFSKTILVSANFEKSNLTGVNFSEANLRNSNLNNTILINSNFTRTNLRGVGIHGRMLITSLSFSPDGKQIAGTISDTFIKIWDVNTGKEITILRGNPEKDTIESWGSNDIDCVCYSPDGRYLLGGRFSGTIVVWDIEKRRILSTLLGHSDRVNKICFHSDNKHVVSCSHDKKVIIWDFKEKKISSVLEGHTHMVTELCISPDGKYIISAGSDTSTHTANLIIWDFKNRSKLIEKNIIYPSYSLTSSPNGRYFACGEGESITIRSILNGEIIKEFPCSDYAADLSFSPDGRYLIGGGDNQILELWTVEKGIRLELKGHKDCIQAVSFSPDGDLFASGGSDGYIIIWNLIEKRKVLTIKEELNCKGMNIKGVKGLSRDQVFFLLQEGAIGKDISRYERY
ncbi:MAG: pentapeptide repeat-containing protein, partial [Candidatus Hodarchaeota archaeon]